MNTDQKITVIVGVGGVVLGWFLGQVTNLVVILFSFFQEKRIFQSLSNSQKIMLRALYECRYIPVGSIIHTHSSEHAKHAVSDIVVNGVGDEAAYVEHRKSYNGTEKQQGEARFADFVCLERKGLVKQSVLESNIPTVFLTDKGKKFAEKVKLLGIAQTP